MSRMNVLVIEYTHEYNKTSMQGIGRKNRLLLVSYLVNQVNIILLSQVDDHVLEKKNVNK